MTLDIGDMTLDYAVHGEGEPLLFLHGALGIGADWQYVFDAAPPGHRVVAPDLRGHGRSNGARATYSFRQAADDMFALLDHLAIGTARIVGVSGGGITALHMATMRPARVSRMVVVSAPPAFPPQAQAIQRVFSESMLPAAEREAMRVRHPRPGQLDQLFAQVRAMADGGDPAFDAASLSAITAETLVVFGDRDPLYPVELAFDLRAAIPTSWLWVVPNGGHAPVFGAQAAEFAKTALEFLDGAFAA